VGVLAVQAERLELAERLERVLSESGILAR
jgi:hypothetical protein